jgi:hypothetical protein
MSDFVGHRAIKCFSNKFPTFSKGFFFALEFKLLTHQSKSFCRDDKKTQKEKEMKKIKSVSLLLNLTLCLTIIVGAYSNASAVSAIATVGPNTLAPNVFYTGGCNGNFNLGTQNAFIRSKAGFGFNPNVTVVFSQMVGLCATYQMSPNGIWHLVLTDPNAVPSTFQVLDNATGNVLLQGTFTKAILHGRTGNSSLALTLWQDNVLYNAASLWFPGGFPLNNGSLSVAILAQQPVIANPPNDGGGAPGPLAFQANGDINFGRQ